MGITERRLLQRREEFNSGYGKRYKENLQPYPDIEETRDVAYSNEAAEHLMDIYRPANTESKLPVIIDVHGGGLSQGFKECNRDFCVGLCRKGFLVFNVDYRLVPEVTTYQQFGDITLAVNTIEAMLDEYGGDASQVYMVGDSAGALLVIYTVAMQKSVSLAVAAYTTPTTLPIKALGLISGMFYTCRADRVGMFLPKALWGRQYKKTSFFEYANPEHPQVIENLPPCYLATSANDELQKYTIDFHKALQANGVPTELDNFPEQPDLSHDFAVYRADLPESQIVIDHMTDFFKQQT